MMHTPASSSRKIDENAEAPKVAPNVQIPPTSFLSPLPASNDQREQIPSPAPFLPSSPRNPPSFTGADTRTNAVAPTFLPPAGKPINTSFFTISDQAQRKENAAFTLVAFLFHAFFYLALFMAITSSLERRIWFAANETTRSLLRQYLGGNNYPGALRYEQSWLYSWIPHFLSPKHTRGVDIILRALATNLFSFKTTGYPLPG